MGRLGKTVWQPLTIDLDVSDFFHIVEPHFRLTGRPIRTGPPTVKPDLLFLPPLPDRFRREGANYLP